MPEMSAISAMSAPTDARVLFTRNDGALAVVERYAGWLVGPGVERGLLGPREPDRIWDRHLINCALLEDLVPPTGSVCDVGSGAGLPGIVLAAMRPAQPFTLLEPLLRRATFLTEVVEDVGLTNVTVVRDRAEDYAKSRPGHDVVVARAVAPLDRLAGWTLPLLRPGGLLLAMKGDSAASQLADAAPALDAADVVDCAVLDVGQGGNVTHVVRVVRPPGPLIAPATEDR